MFLPEGVWFDEQRGVNVGGERLLQRPQHRLHTLPLAAPHVDHHSEATSSDILTDGRVRGRTCEEMRQRVYKSYASGDSPGYGRQVRDQSTEVFLLYSIVIGPGREGQDWSATFVPSTLKTSELDEDQSGPKW